MESNNFKISDEFIKNQNKIVITLMIIIPVMLIVTFLILIDFRIDSTAVTIIALTVIVLDIAIYITMRITLNKMKDNELMINDAELIRKNKKLEEKISLNSITGLKTISDNKNKLLAVKIFFDKQTLAVSGFEKMDDILKILTDKTANNKAEIINKKIAVNFNNPVVLTIYFIVFCSLFVVFIKFNKRLYDNIQYFIPVLIGVYFLIFKPMSKNAGRRFFKFEIIAGIILIALGSLNLFLKYFLLR